MAETTRALLVGARVRRTVVAIDPMPGEPVGIVWACEDDDGTLRLLVDLNDDRAIATVTDARRG